MKKIIVDLIKYFGVAIVAAIVNIGMLYVFTDLCQLNYLISNIISFILGLITNYCLSKKYVFKESSLNKTIEFIVYAVIGIIGLGIDTVFFWLFTSKIGIYYMLSKIITTGLTFLWNFTARKYIYYITKK